MPHLFKKIIGIMLLVMFTSTGCVTLFNSVNFKNAPRDSFVKIELLTDEYAATGSGVIINHINNSNTLILTAGHICHPNIVAMRVLDLYENSYEVLSFVNSGEDDLCVLIVNGIIDGRAMKVADKAPEIGDHIYNIAAPRSIHAPNMSLMFEGYYEGKLPIPEEKYPLDIYNLPGVGGSSGSPVFNDNWEIIGIVSRGMVDFQHVLMTVNQERTKLFYDYIFSDQFIVDFKKASEENNKAIMDFMKTLLEQ